MGKFRAVLGYRRLASPGCASTSETSIAGYVAVDALVALMLISMSLIFGLQALRQADRVADAASEVRRAQTLLTHLLEGAPRGYAGATGESDGFAWRVQMQTTGAERPIEVCRRAVDLTHAATGRTYAAATLEPCPIEDAA